MLPKLGFPSWKETCKMISLLYVHPSWLELSSRISGWTGISFCKLFTPQLLLSFQIWPAASTWDNPEGSSAHVLVVIFVTQYKVNLLWRLDFPTKVTSIVTGVEFGLACTSMKGPLPLDGMVRKFPLEMSLAKPYWRFYAFCVISKIDSRIIILFTCVRWT